MNQAFGLNTMIILLIVIGIFATSNPLFILGLLFLRDLPYGLVASESDNQEEESKPIGFHAEI
jgi:hypothetical protein